MKKQFQSKSVPRGTRTLWRYLGALIILFTFAIGNVWGAYDVPADGTVTLSQKVNNGGRFNVEASGVYHFRTSSGYSWDSSNGIKTQSNAGGVVFYLDASKEIEVGIVHTEAKNAHEVTVHVYSITESVYKQFDDNKAGAAESNRTFSTAPTSSTDGSFTISITAESKTFTGKKTLAAGYYAVVPVGEKSKTFFKTIKFTTTGGGTDVCPSGISITGEDEYTEGETISLTANKTAGNGEITYTWYKGADLATAKAAGALGTGATYTKSNCVTGDAGKYFCEATKTSCSGAASSGFDVTVEADTKCFNMPAITSKPADLASVVVTGGTLSDVSTAKAVAMNANGLKLDGNSVYLKVTLADASIIAGTKITVAWKGAGSGAGIAVVNGDLAEKVIDETNVEAAGSATHTFTAAEAANYADEFIIHRNASGTGIYVNAITVEDCGPAVTKHTITLNYNDGVTPNGSLLVVDGKAATQPADPTRGKYTFLGWNKGSSAYTWSAAVTEDFTLVAQWQDPWTITFDADGGSAVADITVKHNTAADKPTDPTKDDNDFLGWFNGENAYDWTAVVTGNLNLKAHWAPIVAKYDVEYYDGENKIGTEAQVWANQHPTASGINTNKPLYTFVGWYTSSTLEGDPVALNTVTPVEGLKLYGKWTKAYATSYDMEAYAVSEGASKAGLETALTAAGYAYTNINGIDNGHTHNYTYDGLKYKTNDGDLSFNVVAGKVVEVKTGHLPSNDAVTMYINGVASETVFEGADEEQETHKTNYFYSAAEALYRLEVLASKGTCAVKKVTIRDPYTVSFEAHGDADPSALQGMPSVTLPDAANGTSSLLGWFDAETGGNKIGDAGETYIPTANITLHAQWETVSTDARLASITLNPSTGVLSPAFDPEVVNYTYTMPYGTASVPQIVEATSVNANAQDPVIDAQAANWGDVAHIHGVAQSGDTKDYYIQMLRAPKDGVSIFKAELTSATTAAYSGVYTDADNSQIKLADDGANGYKFSGTSNFIKMALNGGKFATGDLLTMTYSMDPQQGELAIYENTTKIVGTSFENHTLEFTSGANDLTELFIRRTSDNNFNGWVSIVEVTRAMNPVLTAITINGEPCVKGEGNTFSITLPEEGTDLAALTVVPTIIRNAPHATTPEAIISNSGAWAEGANTYRVMDKDGDYTDYTITITLQGAAETPVITADPATQAYCAGSEPTLTVAANEPSDGGTLHYAWFKAGETDEAVGSDQASYTVEAAGTYYVIVTNKKEGKLDASATSANAIVTLNAPASITTQPGDLKKQIEGANITLSVVAANATAYQWYSCDNKDKENPSLIAGADEAEYEFAAAAGFFYCEVTGLCGAIESNVAQVTVKRSAGCQYITATSGYEATLADGLKIFGCGSDGKTSETAIFQEATANAKSVDADAVGSINKQYFIVQFPVDVEEFTLYGYNSSDRSIANIRVSDHIGATSADKFTDDMEVDATKTANRDNKDISMTAVLDEPISKENYAYIKFSSSLEVYRICYTAAIAEPKLPTLSNQELCAGAAYEAFDATITNAAACEGTVSYAWYKTTDTENPVATTATYTPTEDAIYYVVVKHVKAGHMTRVAQSAELTVAHFAAPALVSYSEDVFQHMGTAAELSVVATGSGLAYAWYTCDVDGGNAEVISGAEEATYAIASIAEGVQYYKVVISNNCDESTLSHIFKVEGWDQLEQVDVTATTTWDMTNVSANHIELTGADKNARLLLANIDGVNNTTFNAQALKFEGQHIGRTEGNVKHLAGRYVQFNVTVPGMVSVTFASNGSSQRTIQINGKVCSRTTNDGTYITYNVAVEPGSVEIEDVQGYVRISKIEFKAEDSYHRTVNPSYLGTLCWTNNAVIGGATLYEFAGKNENNYLVFDEVEENRLEAGKPYIFMPENGNTEIKVYNTDSEEPLTEDQDPVNHMYGTITGKTLVPGVDDNMYYFSSNHIWAVKDFVVNIPVPAYYCYVDYAAVLAAEPAPAPAPGRRRVTMGVQGEQTATGIDAINASEKPMKLIINGQLFILRGEKMFDATGRLVK